MILGIFWFLVANAASLLGAHAILSRVRTGMGSVDVVLFLVVRLLFISVAVLVAGLTHSLTRLGLGLMSVGALAWLLAIGSHRKMARPCLPEVGRVLAVFAALVGVRLLLQVWFFSPHIGDALAYHLPKIAEWVRAGSFTREMGLHPHVTFPAGFELIETWWVVFFHHDVLIEMAGVEFLVLAFAATYALARHVNLAPRWAFFAAVLYVMTPGLHLSTTSCLNDAPAAALVVATAALTVSKTPIPLVVMTIGLGVGVKPTYGFTLPGLVLLWWLVRRDPVPKIPPRAGLGLILAALAVVVGLFWYARNTVWYGNPFYPLGAQGYVNPVAVQLGPRLASLPENAAALVNSRIYDNQGAYGANVDNISGWGPVPFACGVLALLVGACADARLRRLAVAYVLSLASALLFVQHDPWCLKYVFFFPAVLSTATARWAEANRGVACITAAALALSLVGSMLPYDLPVNDFRVLARQSWLGRSAAEICRAVASGEKVACFGGYTADSYLLYGPDLSRRVVYLRSTTAAGLVADMKLEGIRMLYAAPASPDQQLMLDECIRQAWLRRLGERVYVLQ